MKKALINISTGECENIIVVSPNYIVPNGYMLQDPIDKQIKKKVKEDKINHNGVDYSFNDFKNWLSAQK